MVSLKCTQCGAALHWDGRGDVVTCEYCGAEYLMHPQGEQFRRGNENPYRGKGRVQGIPILPGGDWSGLCPIESYVPENWTIQARQAPDDFYGDHANNPYVVQADYESPKHDAHILFRGTNLYTDRKLSRVPLLKGIDVLGSYLRVASPFSAEQYCDYLVQRDLCPAAVQRLRVEQADRAELERQQSIRQAYQSQGFQQVNSEWKRVIYAIQDSSGKQKIVSAETRLNDVRRGMAQGGGLFGRYLGQMLSADEHYWETQYEFLVIADREIYESILPTAQKINESIQTTRDLEQIRQYLLQYLQGLKNQTAMAMHQQEMASWDRKQGIINDTQQYTMNVMHEMNANTAATHQRVANLHSESIRGVNTYYTARQDYGVPEVVEAGVNWDHVYQNTNQPDIFAAAENVWLQPGVDYEELRRTNGGY